MKALIFLLLYNTGQAQFSTCSSGQYCSNGTPPLCENVCTCVDCPKNMDPNECNNCVLVDDYKKDATGCLSGTFWQAGLKECTDCPAGFFSLDGIEKCSICLEGKKCNKSSSTNCPMNKISPLGFEACFSCPTNYVPDGSRGSCVIGNVACTDPANYRPYESICETTPAGYERLDKDNITRCSAGQFSTPGSTCQDCPVGHKCDGYGDNVSCDITARLSPATPIGTGGCSHCTRGKNCNDLSICGAGKQWDEPSKTCVDTDCSNGPCDGSFQYNCDPGMILNSNTCERCPLKFSATQVDPDVGTCPEIQCPAGYGLAGTNCELCADNYHGDGTTCENCGASANQYCPNKDGGLIDCPTGYYKEQATDISCTPCPAGKSCISGSSPSSCNSNEYSYEGDSECRSCLPGHECNGSERKMCHYGQYLNGNTCTDCSAGYACPNPWENQKPCICSSDECHYQDSAGQVECKPCPAGQRCDVSSANSPIDCVDGEYSLEGQKDCKECPSGSMCPTKTSPPITCEPGFYATSKKTECTICGINERCSKDASIAACVADEYSPAGFSECFKCPIGHDCKTGDPIPCEEGQFYNGSKCTECDPGNFCPIGSNSQITCPVGHYCPAGSFAPSLCEPGTYTITTGKISCDTCDTGYTCDGYTKTICPVGHYCPSSASPPVPCEEGKYQDLIGQTECKTDVADGFYCPPGAIECHLCPAGQYCTGGRKRPCSGTKYSEEEGRKVDCDLDCPKGHYCPGGTSSPFPCPPGWYQDSIAQTTCNQCPPGKSCSSSGLIAPDRNCDHGHYCETSSNYPNSWAPATTWTGGNSNPSKMCPAGKYSVKTNISSDTDCVTCPEGFYCFPGTGNGLINPIKCPAGYYCEGTKGLEVRDADGNEVDIPFQFPTSAVAGTKPSWETGSGENYRPRGCLAGTWSNQTGVANPDECWVCEQGWMCTFGTNKLDQGDVNDLIELPAPFAEVQHDTYFEENYFRRRQIDAMACPKGCFCPPGTGFGVTDNFDSELTYDYINNFYSNYTLQAPQTCPNGTFNDVEGIGRVSDCKDCEPGYYCTGSIKDENQGELNRPPLDEYQPGTVVPDACPPGYYNPNYNGVTLADNCPDCPGGWYCPKNATSVPTECGKGKYSNDTAIECLDCKPGYYCDNSTTSEKDMLENKKCPPGIDCSENSPDWPISIIPELFQNPCPLGYYCEDVDPKPCPQGTFGGEFGLTKETDCTPCTEGYFCPPLVLPPAGQGFPVIEVPSCEFDHVSLGNYTCNAYKECEPGRYCVTGSHEQALCPVSTYQPFPRAKTLDECAPCKSGNYCDDPGLAEPKPCPEGFYCEFNVSTYLNTPCPPGTYGVSKSLRSKYECPLCGGGLFCSGEVNGNIVDGPQSCDPGFYCSQGAPAPNKDDCEALLLSNSVPGVQCPVICPQGAYCPKESFTPLPCDEGTYTTSPGKSDKSTDCVLCKPGHFCSGEVLYDSSSGNVFYDGTSGQCEGGYFCEKGNVRSNGKISGRDTSPCGEGKRCPVESAAEIACTVGSYQEYELGAVCESCPPGHKCLASGGTIDPVICENGEYCNTTVVDCPAGTYLNVSLLYDSAIISPFTMGGITEDECKACPIGSYCPIARTSNPTDCEEGFACLGSQITTDTDKTSYSTECPEGFVCGPGTGSKYEVPCELGTYNNNQGVSDNCLPCTAGKVCDKFATVGDTNVTFVDCPAGYFCPEGACKIVPTADSTNINYPCENEIFECTKGYHCPTNSPEAVECPAGTYSDRRLLSECFDCEPGFYCPGSAFSSQFSSYEDCLNTTNCRLPCPPGSYCGTAGMSAPEPCEVGFNNPYEGAIECLPCEAGKACPTTGIANPTENIEAGYYSISGAESKTPPASSDVHGPCTNGYICGIGQTLPEPCSEGEESESDFMSTTCIACGKGNFCPKKATESTAGLPCLDGFSCKSGCISGNTVGNYDDTNIDDDCSVCKIGDKCEKGIFENCANQYQPSYGQSTCLPCPAGKDCNIGKAADCPAGYYCESGNGKAECAVNTFAEVTGLQKSSECSPCPPGFDCTNDAKPFDTYPTTPCPSGNTCSGGTNPAQCSTGSTTYCPQGSISVVEIPTGSLGVSTDAGSLIDCDEDNFCTANQPEKCEDTYYCPKGTPYKIPCGRPGTSCFKCPENFYCPYDASQNECLPGFLCPENTAVPTELCPVGAICNKGLATDCNGAEYNPAKGQSECIECPAGADCSSTGQFNVVPTPCPGGSFCGFGNATESCAAGSYGTNLSTGAQKQEDCHECPYGKYCTGGADNTSCTKNGKECLIGSATDSPDPCPEGHICILGKKELCPSGEYPDSGSISCSDCSSGDYCPGDGSSNDCKEGYFCPAGSDTLRPDNLCPVGKVCPDGSEVAGDCSAGEKTIELGSEVCIECAAGYYCASGSSEVECAEGKVCAPGSENQSVTCIDGYSSSVTGLTDQAECQQCEVGTFCKDGQKQSCSVGCDCQAGSDSDCSNNCPSGSECSTSTALPCPPGHFNSNSGTVSSCSPCINGKYQDEHGKSDCISSCADGFYCLSGAKSEYPSRLNETDFGICPKGHYCISGGKEKCQEGTYQDREGQNVCFDCPAGYYCDEEGLEDYVDYPCPIGKFCGRKVLIPLDCPAGKYRTTVGARSADECQLCEPGKACPGLNVVQDCPAGYYCFVGAKIGSEPEPFDATIFIDIDGTSSLTVGKCPVGHYCPAGTALPKSCPAGYYCDIEGMSATDANKKCLAGMYCISGAKDNSATVIEGHKIECPEGFYCPEGTEYPKMCPSGTYRNIKGGTDESSSCFQCHAGYVCYQGQVETDENQCPEGFFCEAGVKDIYARTDATYDYFCPIGFSCKDGIKKPCEAGTYQADRGKLTCNTCPSGYFCKENSSIGIFSPASCPEGTYCRAGSSSTTNCPVGTFGLTQNLQTESQCTDCLAGYYCGSEGITQADVLAAECNAGYLCKPGSAGINGERPGSNDPNRCELGSYCPRASPVAVKCPAGKYNDGSLGTMYENCAICREDNYCEYSGTIIPVPCPKFYLCPNQLSDLTGTGLAISFIIAKTGGSVTPFVCPLYHQCDDGLMATAGLCPETTYREEFEMDPSHSRHCQPCPDGKTCSGGQISELCAKGNFCVDEIGTIPCPAGSYNPNLGAFLPIECPDKDIPNLQACAVDQNVCLACPAGYYCVEGSTLPTPCDAGFYCDENSSDKTENICPAGNYCPIGTANPVPCPVGTYIDETEAQALVDCKLCPPKKFCDSTGISQTFSLIDCQEGYFCGAGSPSRTPEVLVDNSNTTGEYYGPCVEGQYCPSGNNAAPIECPPGEFNQLIHQGKCSKCPAGYECLGSDNPPTPCSVGYYCPTSEALPQMCPDGKFNPSTLGYLEKTHCQECPDGKICNGEGQTDPAECPAASYCRDGKKNTCESDKLCESVDQGYEKDCPYGSQCASSTAGPCVAGSYCENSTAIECGPGTYCSSANEKYPTMCLPGSTSTATGATSNVCGDCTNGYCPQYGNSDDTAHTVSDGFYCDATSPCGATSTPNSCEPGFICKAGFKSGCSGVTEFQSTSEQSECLSCGAGFTCATSIEREECEEGTYCAADINIKEKCTAGTLGFVSGGASQEDACRICPPGYTCNSPGLILSDLPTITCPEGEYCEAGSDGTSPTLCEVGKYCNGTETAVYGYPCPVSTFSDASGLKADTDCESCPENRFCPRSGLSEIDDFECLAGYDCSSVVGNYQPNRNDTICPAGQYCEQSKPAADCPADFYLDRIGATKQEDCDVCPAGKDCSKETGIDKSLDSLDPCPSGSYCPGSKTLSCNTDNNYGVCDTTGLTDPIPCSDGTKLEGGVCDSCLAGTKCYLGMQSNIITNIEANCDAGFYCESNTTRLGEPCPSSTYSSSENAQSDSTCEACTEGSFCVGLGQTIITGACEEGYWCSGGNESPRPEEESDGFSTIGDACKPGEECNTISPTLCAKGSYQSDFRKASCEPCPAGFYCDELGTDVPKECPQGYYCLEGTQDTGIICPSGSTGSRPGLEKEGDCTPCAAGKFCNSTYPDGELCDPGYYCSGGSSIPNPCQVDDCDNITEYEPTCWDDLSLSDTVGGICVPGYYCKAGSARPRPCDAGSSCSKAGLNATDGGCEPGYYCPTGSTSPKEKDCIPGHYCEANSAYPEPCPPGTYDNTKLEASTERTNISICIENTGVSGQAFEGWGNTYLTGVDCEAGWYCEKGAYNRYGDLCTRHHYCPNATYLPIPCPTGQWQPNAGSVICTDCPAGWFCNETDIGLSRREPPAAEEYPKPCEVGYYCPAGTLEQVECPPGTYGNRSRLASEDDCVACPPGYFCDGGVIVDMCRPGTFCTGGQGPDYAPGLSYFLDITDSQRPQYQYPVNSSGICITGTYCPEGSHAPIPCPPGYFGSGSNNSDFNSACEPVGEGSYVGVEGGNNDTVSECQSRFHCQGRAKLSRPYDDAVNANLGGRVCQAGHKCENGRMDQCVEGSFQGDEGQLDCLECTPGFLCPTTGVILPDVCPEGSYCGSGSTNGTECDINFFNPVDRQSDPSSCYPCKGGYNCNGGNNVDVCELRYYCPEGQGEKLCPSGHLCTYEQSSPEPCETGSYQPLPGKTECEPCEGGHYCEFRGAANVTGPCEGGYYCNGNVTDPRPSQDKCEQGEACPIGAVEPELCNNGTYAPLDLMEECELCPAGYYCDGKVTKSFWRTDYVGVILPTECNEDGEGNIIHKNKFGYCEPGSPLPVRCPRGSLVKGYPQLFDSTECEPCPTGSYCEDGDIAGVCAEGTFCLASSGNQNPSDKFFDENILSDSAVCDTDQSNGCAGKCPPGYLCEEGTILPIPCPQGQKHDGKYGSLFTKDPVCVSTSEGEFGVQGYFDSSGAPYLCPEGYYCPGLDSTNTTDPIPCPEGTFMNSTGATTACVNCSAGYDCTELGLRNFETFICPPGHICLEGEGREMCPNATWRADVGGKIDIIGDEDGCDLCPEGEYCPDNVINDAGVPCPPGITCEEGSDSPTELCPAGYYCPESSYHERFPCSAGFYCEDGSWNETVCEFPYYCPPQTGKEFGKTCDLGHGALAGLNRTNEAEFCQLCPAGTYRSREEQPECEPCPAGMSCPVGTGQDPREPILCPIGHYCPTGNPLGRPIPCPSGTFSNEVGAQQEACQACPVDTYNNVEGQAACRLCGTASIAREGSTECQCIGSNRIFQFSDGSCICKQGYESHGYIETDDETEVNKKSDCVAIVNDRCDDGFVRDAFTRECITVGDANKNCEESGLVCSTGSAFFDQNYGTCFCPIVDAVEDIPGCCYIPQASVDVATGQLTIDGEEIYDVYGLSPVNKTSAFTVSLSDSGVFAELPVNGSVRSRRQAELASSEQIQQPAICVIPGEMVLFELKIENPRSDSFYPKYKVGSLYNSNPEFDYGAFRTLEAVILDDASGNLNFDKFAYIFEQEGNFVFYSSQDDFSTIIIHVALEGTSCGTGTVESENIRVQPQSERTFSAFGISRTTNINLTPNWPLIASLSFTIILLILILLIFSTVWSRKDRSFSPWQYWKPKYLATDMPYIYPPLVAKKMEHNMDKDLLDDENQQREDHLTSQELFDRLEDQNLQIASQMQNHQRQLQEYFESMHQEASKLQAFIQKAKEPKQQTGDIKSGKIQKNEYDHVTAIKSRQTVTVQDRTAARALMTTVQQLLNQLNQGRVLVTEEMVDAVLQKKSDKNFGLDASEQEKIIKEEIELVEKLCTIDLDSEDELARLVKEEADLLANARDENERHEIIANYAAMKAGLQKKRRDDLDRQKIALRQRLVARRRQDLAKKGLSGLDEENDQLIKDMENKTEKMVAEERSGAIQESIIVSKQIHSDKKKRIKAVYMNKMSARVKPESKDQFVIAADNAMDEIEQDFAAKILSDLERVDESGSLEWEEMCKSMECNFASEQEIATAKANHEYQLLVEKQAILENNQTAEIDEISKTLQGLIEKYSTDPDAILNDFNQQMAELEEGSSTEKQRQNQSIQDRLRKLHKDKISEIERDALARLKAMSAIDMSGDDELDGQLAQQLAEVADKQASEREELERELAENETEEQRRLEEELARKQKQTMSELNAKQQAEIEARQGNLTDSQMKMMLLAHSKAQEEAQDALSDKHSSQQDALKARLAKMRRDKTMKLESNQEEEMSQEKERIDDEIKEQTRQKQLEAEKEAAMKLIADTGASTEEVIDAIMDRRHRAEIEAFNAAMEEKLSQRLEAATEDGVLSEHTKAKIEHELEVEKAAGLLNLKEKHYQEKLNMLTELAPHAAKNAENDKKKLEMARKKIEEEQAEQERELAAEREKWEAEQKRQMQEEMNSFEAELDQKLIEEEQRLAAELDEKQQQRERTENEKKQQLEEELAQKLAENAQADHARLLAEHQSQVDKISARQGLDKAKMAEQIKKRLEAKKQIAMKEKQVEVDGEQQNALEDFEKNQVEKISEKKATVDEVEEEEFDGPLTEAQLKKVLAGLPLLGSLNNIKTFLQKSFLDEDVVYGDISPIDISELDKVELCNYNYAIYLLKFFKINLREGDATRIIISEPLPQSKNEFGTDLYVNGNDLVIRRRVFSTETGKLAVVLSWAFATAVGEQKKSRGKVIGFIQQVFFQTQSLLMNEAFLLLSSDKRHVPK